MSGNERINPPVIPKSTPIPPEKFEKTGAPTVPSRMYASVEIVPFFAPRAIPASGTASVCMVIGTPYGIGMLSCDIIAMMAVKMAIRQRSRIDMGFLVIDASSVLNKVCL